MCCCDRILIKRKIFSVVSMSRFNGNVVHGVSVRNFVFLLTGEADYA